MPDYFFLPPMNIAGDSALDAAVDQIAAQGFKKTLVMTDAPCTERSMPRSRFSTGSTGGDHLHGV